MTKKEIIVYHGSEQIIDSPQFNKGNIHNDYGKGFYCTESIELAKEWSVGEERDGYANKYLLNTSDLKTLDLTKTASTLNWITILLKNRIFSLKHDVAKEGKDYLIKNFDISIDDYDLIKGYRADDSYFTFADNFLNNMITLQRLSSALRLGGLGEQIVLKSEKAFDSITFIKAEKADATTYYPLREKRNAMARDAYLKHKQDIHSKDDIYLIDLIRGRIRYDDPRLRQ